MPDRKPIGTCEVCGKAAYKRFSIPRRWQAELGATEHVLCYLHYMRGWRAAGNGLPPDRWYGRNRAMTAEEVERARALRAKGLSYQAIADELGRDKATIIRRCRSELRQPGTREGPP